MPSLITCLWFDKQAAEAADFYVKVFREAGRTAKIGRIARYGESTAGVSGQANGSVMTVEFELDGRGFLGLNGGPLPSFKFSPATSFIISCKTQEEIDHFWSKLVEGGREGQCGWIDYDKFGITWQVVPAMLSEIMGNPDPEKVERATKAMLAMKKIEIKTLMDAMGS